MVHVSVLPGRWHNGPAIAFAVVLTAVVTALAVTAVVLFAALSQVSLAAPVAAGPATAGVAPGLVNVTATLPGGQVALLGTGMVLTPAGRVLTNNHVIEGAAAISVTDVGNGLRYAASVVGYDASQDVAVLQLTGASGLETVPLGSGTAAAARIGEQVTALGNAGGQGPLQAAGTVTGLGVTAAVVDSADGITEHLSGLISASLPLQPGDSGGTLIGSGGLVIGMDTAVSSQHMTGSERVTVSGLAIPIAAALRICTEIVTGQASATVHIGPGPHLGAVVAPGPAAVPGSAGARGASVSKVLAGTPAASAGLTAGDVIVALGGRPVTSGGELTAALLGYHPADRVSVVWVDQQGTTQSAVVSLTAGLYDW